MTRQTAKIETPLSMDPKGETKFEEIPLPPQELWAELDNTGDQPAAGAPTQEAPAPAIVKRPAREIAELEFTGKKPFVVVPLEYEFPFGGRTISEITVRRLSIGEVGNLIDSLPADRIDNFDVYAAMTGLPAAILRGLVDVDGERVTEACYDFLHRSFRRVHPPAPASS